MMKRSRKTKGLIKAKTQSVLAACSAVTAAMLLSACGTAPGYEQAARGSAYAVDISRQVALAETSLESAVVALDQLRESPVVSPREQLQQFRLNVNTAAEAWEEITEYVNDLDETMDAYMATWGADSVRLADRGMRQTAAERREEVRDILDSFESEYLTASAMVNPAVERMNDLVRLLENDLSEQGLRAAEDAMLETRETIGEMRTQLDNLRVHASRVAEYLSPVEKDRVVLAD